MKLEQTVRSDSVERVLTALANRLTYVDNMQAKLLGPITTPGAPDTEFTVTHGLGAKPVGYIVNVDQGSIVYDSRRANWTESLMYLKCTGVSVVIYLVVFP